jgi:hypothetical protein
MAHRDEGRQLGIEDISLLGIVERKRQEQWLIWILPDFVRERPDLAREEGA